MNNKLHTFIIIIEHLIQLPKSINIQSKITIGVNRWLPSNN